MNSPNDTGDLARRNRKTALMVFGLIALMVLLVANSVTLYRIYCQITGQGGTATQAAASTEIIDREITVRFNADVNKNLNWSFKAEQQEVKVKVGQEALVSFRATNRSSKPIAGTAMYNITPDTVGKYFNKTQCFCFNYQLIQPGRSVNFPVVFYIDPKIMKDREADGLKTITLSYTFFKADSPELEQAMQDFTAEPKSANKAIPINN